MKKMMFAVAASALAFSGAAHAASFTPASTTARFQGTVDVEQTTALSCTMWADVATTALSGGVNTAAVTNADLTGGLCGLVNFSGFNWPVTVIASSGGVATQLRISGITVGALGGTCSGNMDVNWAEPTAPATTPASNIDFPLGTNVPGTDFFGNPAPCYIEGKLNQITPAPATATVRIAP